MKRAAFFSIMLPVLLCLVLTGCSGSTEVEQPKASDKTLTEQTADAIREHGRRPIDKARTTQQLGDERTRAIDKATKQQ